MLDIMNWKKNENFHKEDFNRFVREVAVQAEKIQTEHRGTHASEYSYNKGPKWKGNRTLHVVRKNKQVIEAPVKVNQCKLKKPNENLRGLKRKRDYIQAPLCLNPVCKEKGKRHYISNCDILDKETRTTLLEEYRKTKKARFNNVIK